MDESNGTCNGRFAKLRISISEDNYHNYCELIVTTPDLSKYISGAILYDDTTWQSTQEDVPFVKVMTDTGMIPGIKVDTGAKELSQRSGEKVTEGLDGLRDRLKEYYEMGARFAKWRAVITIGKEQSPWQVTFSYARAIQQPALEHWRGNASNIAEAQKLLLHRAMCNSAASQGTYSADMEKQTTLV